MKLLRRPMPIFILYMYVCVCLFGGNSFDATLFSELQQNVISLCFPSCSVSESSVPPVHKGLLAHNYCHADCTSIPVIWVSEVKYGHTLHVQLLVHKCKIFSCTTLRRTLGDPQNYFSLSEVLLIRI